MSNAELTGRGTVELKRKPPRPSAPVERDVIFIYYGSIKMAECYTATIKDWRRKSARTLRDMKKSYDSLQNKESEYAKDILSCIEICKRVDEIYANASLEI